MSSFDSMKDVIFSNPFTIPLEVINDNNDVEFTTIPTHHKVDFTSSLTPSFNQLSSELIINSLSLPLLNFSNIQGEKVKLISINNMGKKLFGKEALIGKELNFFLSKNYTTIEGNLNEVEEEEENYRLKLLNYSNTGSTTQYSTPGVILDYYTSTSTNTGIIRNHHQAEVIVQLIHLPTATSSSPSTSTTTTTFSNTSFFSILFLRDILLPNSTSTTTIESTPSSSLPSSLSPSPSPSSPSTSILSPHPSIPSPSQSTLPPIPRRYNSSPTISLTNPNPTITTTRPLPDNISANYYPLPPKIIIPGISELDAGDKPAPEGEEEKSGIGYYFKSIKVEHMEVFNESNYKDILDHLPMICFTADNKGMVQYFNRQWYDYTGIPHDSGVESQLWIQYFHSDDMLAARTQWSECMITGNNFLHEYRIKGVDGNFRWFVARSNPLRSKETGLIYQWVSTIIEIQELIQSRDDALRTQTSISAVLLGAVLLSVDSSSIITLFEGSKNTAASAVGLNSIYPDSNCLGKPLNSVWPDERLSKAVENILSKKVVAETWLVETEVNLDNTTGNGNDEFGSHLYRYRLVPLKSTCSENLGLVIGVIIVIADVTKLVTAERDLEASKAAQLILKASEISAVESSRLKTEFVTNISHELRTPIATMIGICEILIDDETLINPHRTLIEDTLRAGEILLDLVGMVLDMGKVEAGKLVIEHRAFSLPLLLADTALFALPVHKKGVKFIQDIGDFYTGGLLIGDRVRTRQIIANGLSNSIKFTKTGSITLKVSQEEETSTRIIIIFEIKDTGIGITPEVLSTLFVPFQQADSSTAREFGGTGLGLAIARNLVELMGGSVELASKFGVGTTMTIRIPFDKASSLDDVNMNLNTFNEVILPARDYPSWKNTRILIAEDNDLIRSIVTRLLIRKNFQVTGVSDGAAAVQAVIEGDFDLILMDGQMPIQDGYVATSTIRQLSDPMKRNIKIIALTASAFKGDELRCLNAGMNGYLAKPVRKDTLEAMIYDHLIGSSKVSSPSIPSY